MPLQIKNINKEKEIVGQRHTHHVPGNINDARDQTWTSCMQNVCSCYKVLSLCLSLYVSLSFSHSLSVSLTIKKRSLQCGQNMGYTPKCKQFISWFSAQEWLGIEPGSAAFKENFVYVSVPHTYLLYILKWKFWNLKAHILLLKRL